MKRKFILFAGACLAFAVSPAMAADVNPPSTTVDEVIVTATLRSENLQEVPIAVTAVTAASLERAGVKDIKGLDTLSSSYNMNTTQTQSGGASIRIRGVGTTGNNAGLESAVGIFIDGVYVSRPGIALGDLLDVEQVELLRGPQGTLFGRNTSSGALNIRTARPALDTLEGFANATYGNYNLRNVQAGISGPIIADQLGFRISGAWRGRDGFTTNSGGGESQTQSRFIVRGQLLWEPTDDVSMRLIVDHSALDEDCCDALVIKESSYAALGLFAANGLPANGGVSISGPAAISARRTATDEPFQERIEQTGVSYQLDWDLGDADLTWIAGYRKSRSRTQQEDFVAVDVYSTSIGTSVSAPNAEESYTKITTMTQEVRLTGSLSERFDYLLGAYYADERIRDLQSLSLGEDHQAYISSALSSVGVPGPNPARNIFAGGVSSAGSYANNFFTQDARNWSIFTNNTFHITDRVAFNFGLRYSNDHKEGAFEQLSASSPACAAVIANAPFLGPLTALAPLARGLTCFPFATQVGQGPVEFDRVFKDETLVYTFKLTGKVTEDVNTYVSLSHGYKAGGFNLDPTAAIGGGDPRFKSETVDAYELGVKAQLFDGRLTANLAVFHQDLEDFQVLEFTGVQFVTFNVAKAKSTGFELELVGRPTEGLTLNGAVTYADARYPDDCGGSTPAPSVSTLCGSDLTNAPNWVVIGGFNYQRDLGDNLTLAFSGNARYESDRRISTQPVTAVFPGTGTEGPTLNLIRAPFDIQEANTKVNLRLALGSQDERWRVELWGNNIFDEETISSGASVPLRGIPSLPGPANAGGISFSRLSFLQDPRTFGVTLRSKF